MKIESYSVNLGQTAFPIFPNLRKALASLRAQSWPVKRKLAKNTSKVEEKHIFKEGGYWHVG